MTTRPQQQKNAQAEDSQIELERNTGVWENVISAGIHTLQWPGLQQFADDTQSSWNHINYAHYV